MVRLSSRAGGVSPADLDLVRWRLMPQRPVELEEGRKFGEADDNLFVGDKARCWGTD